MKMVSLTSFWEMKIEELKAEGRFSTAYIYEYALRTLAEFVGGGEIFFGGGKPGMVEEVPGVPGRKATEVQYDIDVSAGAAGGV